MLFRPWLALACPVRLDGGNLVERAQAAIVGLAEGAVLEPVESRRRREAGPPFAIRLPSGRLVRCGLRKPRSGFDRPHRAIPVADHVVDRGLVDDRLRLAE